MLCLQIDSSIFLIDEEGTKRVKPFLRFFQAKTVLRFFQAKPASFKRWTCHASDGFFLRFCLLRFVFFCCLNLHKYLTSLHHHLINLLNSSGCFRSDPDTLQWPCFACFEQCLEIIEVIVKQSILFGRGCSGDKCRQGREFRMENEFNQLLVPCTINRSSSRTCKHSIVAHKIKSAATPTVQ